MKLLKFSDLIFYIALTSLVVYDFFPDAILPNIVPGKWIFWLIIGLIILSLIFKYLHDPDKKESTAEQIFVLLYFLSLIVVLTLLGGTSTSGLGLNDIGVWIATVIAIWKIVTSIRKRKTDTA
ncbi:hypothetical protein [Desemzia sp. FAM 23991]|uniref:hypothetical protein n=1 Tax=unclassified Desemzia TaxID=2685243 RepID=UPI0038865D14